MTDTSWEAILIGGKEKRDIVIVNYDPSWPQKFEEHAQRIRQALQEHALLIEHIGSTSVPGLAAKAVIDIDVVVADSSDEASYLPALEAVGYELRVREPDWHQHRMLRTPARDVHVHVFSPNSPEVERHLRLCNHLRQHESDRILYETTKRRLASQSWDDMNAYAEAKSEVVEGILTRAHALA